MSTVLLFFFRQRFRPCFVTSNRLTSCSIASNQLTPIEITCSTLHRYRWDNGVQSASIDFTSDPLVISIQFSSISVSVGPPLHRFLSSSLPLIRPLPAVQSEDRNEPQARVPDGRAGRAPAYQRWRHLFIHCRPPSSCWTGPSPSHSSCRGTGSDVANLATPRDDAQLTATTTVSRRSIRTRRWRWRRRLSRTQPANAGCRRSTYHPAPEGTSPCLKKWGGH